MPIRGWGAYRSLGVGNGTSAGGVVTKTDTGARAVLLRQQCDPRAVARWWGYRGAGCERVQARCSHAQGARWDRVTCISVLRSSFGLEYHHRGDACGEASPQGAMQGRRARACGACAPGLRLQLLRVGWACCGVGCCAVVTLWVLLRGAPGRSRLALGGTACASGRDAAAPRSSVELSSGFSSRRSHRPAPARRRVGAGVRGWVPVQGVAVQACAAQAGMHACQFKGWQSKHAPRRPACRR